VTLIQSELLQNSKRLPDMAAQAMYASFAEGPDGMVTRAGVEAVLAENGLRLDDPRLASLSRFLDRRPLQEPINFEDIAHAIVGVNTTLLTRALRGELIIPDFNPFTRRLANIFELVQSSRSGTVASYIPQLARVNSDAFAMAVCTIDGQQFWMGDVAEPYCVQSTCKPINYAIAHDRLGADVVHRHVGREPSGRSFNEITLNSKGLPHNPMINAGAIVCASLIAPEFSPADRFDSIITTWRALAGGRPVGFDNAIFLSERDTADRNFALAYFMRENGAFPPSTDLRATLDLYFQCCSIAITAPQMAIVAATLANGGVCPLTNERIFKSETVKNCLSLMASCGMYDFSGEFAFTVGLPAKSGVSGALFITIPGVCGIALWSPRLDGLGNSVRGVEFSKRLVNEFAFHGFTDLVADSRKVNPRRSSTEIFVDEAMHLCAASAKGDINELRRLVARNVDINRSDYDGRTALHLAASDGRVDAVRFLLERGANTDVLDRWGNRPLDDAERGRHVDIIDALQSVSNGKKNPSESIEF
jgi:glutaminase